MSNILKSAIILTLVLFTIISCNQDSGTVSKYKDNKSPAAKIDDSEHEDTNSSQSFADELHTVVVDEVLPAKKYVYVHVSEGVEQYWVATALKDISVGETYFFRGGLLKTNFESKEYNRMFEKIYLVSQFVPVNHGNNADLDGSIIEQKGEKENKLGNNDVVKIDRKIEKVAGSISIAELVNNYQEYEGQTVQLSGECVKINPKIMGKNWIHLKDGSKDDYDLVITSDIFVREGTVITIKATVTLNKDFGAGYKYDLILEDGILVE